MFRVLLVHWDCLKMCYNQWILKRVTVSEVYHCMWYWQFVVYIADNVGCSYIKELGFVWSLSFVWIGLKTFLFKQNLEDWNIDEKNLED